MMFVESIGYVGFIGFVEQTRWYDLIREKEWIATNTKLSIVLQPYDVVWLKPYSEME